MQVYVHIHMSMYVCVFFHLPTYLSVYVSAFMYVYIYVYIYIYMCVCICIYLSMHARLCLLSCVSESGMLIDPPYYRPGLASKTLAYESLQPEPSKAKEP